MGCVQIKKDHYNICFQIKLCIIQNYRVLRLQRVKPPQNSLKLILYNTSTSVCVCVCVCVCMLKHTATVTQHAQLPVVVFTCLHAQTHRQTNREIKEEQCNCNSTVLSAGARPSLNEVLCPPQAILSTADKAEAPRSLLSSLHCY